MLRGKNVLLRATTREDLPRLHMFNNDLAVELAGGGDPPMPQLFEQLEAEFNERAGHSGRDGSNFVIQVDGLVIGHCALFNHNHTNRTCELGVTIGDHNYWGRGYGREVVNLLLDFAFRLHNYRRVYLEVHASNKRAIRAYQACGFVEEGHLRQHVWSNGAYDDLIIMGILHDQLPE